MEDEKNFRTSFLNIVQYPAIIVNGKNIFAYNENAGKTFHITSSKQKNITEIWPDYNFQRETTIEKILVPGRTDIVFAVVNTRRINKEEILVTFRIGDNQPRTMEPDTGYGSPAWLNEKLRQLMKIFQQLNNLKDLNAAYKKIVTMARERLDIDRLAILLINRKKGTYHGTWGTDENGDLSDESGFELALDDSDWIKETLENQVYSIFQENITLWTWGKPEGTGWSAKINLWHGNENIGWLAADNLLSRRPLTPSVKELLRQLGASLNQFLSYKEAEEIRQKQQQELEILLAEKTSELERQYNRTILINRKLAEQESLRMQGESIAGIAHELSNPIGVCVTAASALSDFTLENEQKFQTGKLTESELRKHFDFLGDVSRILTVNISEAARLVDAFKKTSISRVSDQLIDFNLKELFEAIILSHRYRWKRLHIQFETIVRKSLSMHSYPGLLMQIMNNLITNSIVHAFENTEDKHIRIEAEKQGMEINIRYSDNGCGISEEKHGKIFDSFFTSKRGSGGSGLGLYLVKDIVENQLMGSLLFESAPGKGVQFGIRIPASAI